MSPTMTASRHVPTVALALLGVLAGGGRAEAAPSAPPVRRYTIRAEVVHLPARPGEFLTLRHEAVDDFTDITGAVVGMDSMIMPFPVAEDASLDGLKEGDKIEALLEVDWGKPSYQLDRIRKLPPGVVLHFRKARGAEKSPSQPDETTLGRQP